MGLSTYHIRNPRDLLKREKELLLWSHAIEGSISDICLKNYKVFGDGLQNLSDINASVEHAHDRVHGFRAELTRIRQQTVAKAKEIYRKQEIIGRMKVQSPFNTASSQWTDCRC
jgi:hypothetical protein